MQKNPFQAGTEPANVYKALNKRQGMGILPFYFVKFVKISILSKLGIIPLLFLKNLYGENRNIENPRSILLWHPGR